MNNRTRTTSQSTDLPEQYKTFSLRGPRDLLRKLEWDIGQLQATLSHTVAYHYQAINCAITAWQMCDWVYVELDEQARLMFPTERRFRDYIKQRSQWLTICRELADASKHRRLKDGPAQDIGTLSVDVFVTTSGELIVQMLVSDGSAVYSAEQVMHHAYDFWSEYLDELGL